VETSRLGRFIPGKEVLYPFYGRLGGAQGRYWWVRKISPAPGFDPLTVRPVALEPYHAQCLKQVLVYVTIHTFLDCVLREGVWGEKRCADGRTTKVSNNYYPHKSQQWSTSVPPSYFRQLFDFYYQTIQTPQQRRIYSVTTHRISKRWAIYCTALSEQIISNEMRPPTDLLTNTKKKQGTVQIFRFK